MDRYLENIEHKAAVLCDALPYIRDFVNKIIVVEYDCGEWLSGVEEKKLMKDIVLLKSIGVIPIVVHRTPMGVDKFRENQANRKDAGTLWYQGIGNLWCRCGDSSYDHFK